MAFGCNDTDFHQVVCVFGVFDGIHKGHQFLFTEARQKLLETNAHLTIITFDKDPDTLFRPVNHQKLMSDQNRLNELSCFEGVGHVCSIAFDTHVASLSPQEFLDTLFADAVPSDMYVGENFHFGKGASGDVATLENWGREHGMAVHAVPLLKIDQLPVTSTRIRNLLREGSVEQAACLLGRSYEVQGTVVEGRKVGRKLGISTANIAVTGEILIPQEGVYAGYAEVDGFRYRAAISLGLPATFDDAHESTIEAHLLDFDGDVYGKTLTLSFVKRLRPMQKFDSPEHLVSQIKEDIEHTKQLPLGKG